MRLYHATPAEFEQFDESYFGSLQSRHANGCLGVWLATRNDWIRGFGSNIIEVEADFTSTMQMTVDRLRQLEDGLTDDSDDPRPYYRILRRNWLNEGYDSIAIMEYDGRVDMYVALDLSKLKITARVNTMTDQLMSSYDWLKQPQYADHVIMDHDGWNRSDLDASMSELITEGEFNKRLMISTVSIKRGTDK